MDTNDEYEYEYELPDYHTYPLRNKTEEDANIAALRSEDYSNPDVDEHTIELFAPDEIVLYLNKKTDTLQQQYYDGYATGNGKRYFLDAYPMVEDYKYATPGGVTKSNILYTLDHIRTEGLLSNEDRLKGAMPGRVNWQLSRDYKIIARNIGFIWIPGIVGVARHAIWWFIEDQGPEEIKLYKRQNAIKWRAE